MSVTELAPATDTYAEGLARASKTEAEAEAQQILNEDERERRRKQREREAAKADRDERRALKKEQDEDREREEKRREEAKAKAKAEKSAEDWKKAAKAIAILCVIVSLPLQIMAFWDPHAWFLVVAPFVLEGVAWALLKGAEAAIDDNRPSWHYRLGALTQALIAAGINYAHGSEVYGEATGIGGALCSLIGPMIWDLHENGRIAKKAGGPSRKERRAKRREQQRRSRPREEGQRRPREARQGRLGACPRPRGRARRAGAEREDLPPRTPRNPRCRGRLDGRRGSPTHGPRSVPYGRPRTAPWRTPRRTKNSRSIPKRPRVTGSPPRPRRRARRRTASTAASAMAEHLRSAAPGPSSTARWPARR